MYHTFIGLCAVIFLVTLATLTVVAKIALFILCVKYILGAVG